MMAAVCIIAGWAALNIAFLAWMVWRSKRRRMPPTGTATIIRGPWA